MFPIEQWFSVILPGRGYEVGPMSELDRDLYAKLRDARQSFRVGQHVQAYLTARELSELAPDSEEIETFREAVAKSLNHAMRQASRDGDYVKARNLAEALLTDVAFGDSAREVLVYAATRSLPDVDSVPVLLQIAGDVPDTAVWSAIGERLGALPPGNDTIEIGFRILEALPGHQTTLALLAAQIPTVAGPPDADLKKSEEKAQADLADRIAPEADLPLRRVIYTQSRDALLQTEAGDHAVGTNRLWLRLAIERAIAANEIGLRPEVRGAPTDSWSLIDPVSPHYALKDAVDPALTLLKQCNRRSKVQRGIGARIRGIISLWIQSTNREASLDRIGYLWLVADPLIHVLIICAMPVIIHRNQIMDMNVFPFGVIGACYWLVFRTATTGAMSGGGVLIPQLEHTPVRRFDIIMAKAVNALIVYFFVGGTLLITLMAFGQSDIPQNLPMFLFCFFLNWMFGVSYGIIGNSLLHFYPGFRRVNGFLMRLYGLTAGLFFVSEQLPDWIAEWLLWNPLLNTVQLGRSFWFQNYTTRDSSWFYVMVFLGSLLLMALTLLKLDERRVHGVRA